VPSLFAGTLQVLRGVLIGLAEIVPGVSGGTIALVVGVYQALISGAARFARAGVALLRSRFSLARSEMAGVSWKVIVPVIAGMGVGIIAGAALLEPVINDYPQLTLGVFSGSHTCLVVDSVADGRALEPKNGIVRRSNGGGNVFLFRATHL